MSVLLAGLDAAVTEQLVRRLVAQGDQVRVIVGESDPAAGGYSAAGAFVARGGLDDDDLVERAAQNVETIVLGDVAAEEAAGMFAGAARAGVERVVALASGSGGALQRLLDDWGGSYVLLRTGRRRVWGARTVGRDLVVAAVDAADALTGDPRLDLDLTEPSALAALGLPAEQVQGRGPPKTRIRKGGRRAR